jgi:hypothetical protein
MSVETDNLMVFLMQHGKKQHAKTFDALRERAEKAEAELVECKENLDALSDKPLWDELGNAFLVRCRKELRETKAELAEAKNAIECYEAMKEGVTIRVHDCEAELAVCSSAYEELNRELIRAKMDYSDEIAAKDAESKVLTQTTKELVDAYPNLFPRICACCGKSL